MNHQEVYSPIKHDQRSAVVCSIIVAILWGLTNPLIKKGAHGMDTIVAQTIVSKFFKQILFLVKRWQYLLPFLLNQCGSILYVSNLGNSDLSLIVPVTNGLTFAFTAITGWISKEEKLPKNVYTGMFLIFFGSVLCCLEKFTIV
ncbi:hypothetical protein PV326_004601 [Microctonus aethiopoides]|uniref:Transmembrane protein 234 n=1 Tax=Microctonus aethiopoides TaxID=144406 RepID=A0AA39F7C8_9HYME|nr:hypothetical protein PV326_004601 [Microctonus aethiopoides]KAK0164209.1 hypothetical protein PV328_002863 [Microctonus aethiopoides]